MPLLVRQSAAWAWRLLVLAVAAVVVLRVLTRLEIVVVPLALALIASSLLLPAVDRLDGLGWPRGLAVAVVLLTGLGGVGAVLGFVGTRLVDGLPGVADQLATSIEALRHWLTTGPLELSDKQVNNIGDSAIAALRDHQARLTNSLLTTATTITNIVTGFFFGVFGLVVFLHGGRGIYRFVTLIIPGSVRARVRRAGTVGFGSLAGYVRATLFVALIDAVGIGTGLFIMGVPLALPLASLVFFGAFVPIVGAVVTGLLAVIVALLAKGWLYAVFTLALVVAVQQLEGNVLQPLVMGRAVALHPLAVLLALSAGGIIAGVAGMLLAVPTLAFIDRAVRDLHAQHLAVMRNGAVTPSSAGRDA